MANNHSEIEKRLWASADELRANSKLKSSEYSVPVLGLIFLRYADHRFTQAETELKGKGTGRRAIGKEDYQAKGVMFLPPTARFSHLLTLPEGENIGKAINEAMKAVEAENEELKGVLPKSYTKIDNSTLVALLKNLSAIPVDAEGDTFGKIYEYFLGNFARAEGQKGGEFFTPTSLVKLIVQIIEPYHGRIFDPACGSGGMFVQSADFVKAHQHQPHEEIAVYGQERVDETRQLCLMNLAVHALSGDIRQGNSYYEDLHESVGKFDFVMANPPFNVDKVDKERIKDDPRYPLGMPRADNANYLWIQMFYSALNAKGRAGFVMHDSASDAQSSERTIRTELIKSGCVDVVVAIATKFFYTVTQSCTLWFLDNGKVQTPRRIQVLFIDARHIYTQLDRAHREFSPEQLEFLANIVRLHRGQQAENNYDSAVSLAKHFPEGKYVDSPGLCKAATLEEIAAQGYSLNPARYVEVIDDTVGVMDRKNWTT
jgi:type I restriction enzyme M protein